MGYAQRQNSGLREMIQGAMIGNMLLKRGDQEPIEPDALKDKLDRRVEVGCAEQYVYVTRPEPTEPEKATEASQ